MCDIQTTITILPGVCDIQTSTTILPGVCNIYTTITILPDVCDILTSIIPDVCDILTSMAGIQVVEESNRLFIKPNIKLRLSGQKNIKFLLHIYNITIFRQLQKNAWDIFMELRRHYAT